MTLSNETQTAAVAPKARAPRKAAAPKAAKAKAPKPAKAETRVEQSAVETVETPANEIAVIGHNSKAADLTIDQISSKLLANHSSQLRSHVKHALDQGELLFAARAHFASDIELGQWLKEEGITRYIDVRTAYNFRVLFQNFGHLSVEQVTRIGITNGYRMSKKEVPEEARAEAIQKTKKAGAKLSGRDVETIISKHVGERITSQVRARKAPKPETVAPNWARAVATDEDDGIEDAEVISETSPQPRAIVEDAEPQPGLLTGEQYDRLLILVEGDAELFVLLSNSRDRLV